MAHEIWCGQSLTLDSNALEKNWLLIGAGRSFAVVGIGGGKGRLMRLSDMDLRAQR